MAIFKSVAKCQHAQVKKNEITEGKIYSPVGKLAERAKLRRTSLLKNKKKTQKLVFFITIT